MPRRAFLLGVFAALLLAGGARSASPAAPGLVRAIGDGGCVVTAPAKEPGCLSERRFHGRGAVMSPDGKWLYTFGGFDDISSISVFHRSPQTGLLSPAGCPCGSWVNKPTAAAISPDGRDIFLTGWCCSNSSFTAVHLDRRSGALLTPVCCTTSPRAVDTGDDVAVSPDGRNVYIASSSGTGHGLAILSRDPQSGALTQPEGEAGCIQRIGADGCARSPTTSFAPSQVVVSNDGRWVYVLSNSDVFSFARDPGTGGLSAGPCFASNPEPPCSDLLPGGVSLFGLAVSPDGRNVYAAGWVSTPASDFIVALTVDPSGGGPSAIAPPSGCVALVSFNGACREAPTLKGNYGYAQWGDGNPLAVSRDGRTVYFLRPRGIALFARQAGGTLRQAGELKVPPSPRDAPVSITPSSDRRFVYVTEEGYLRGTDAIFLYRARAARSR